MKILIFYLLSITTASAVFAADKTTERVHQLFASFDKPGSPGCSVGVIRNGNFDYKKSFGFASLELGVPVTPESVFYMGSVSKQFTAASVVLAAEQGYLSLDDDVHKYIPELLDYGHPVTLRQMLHQTSGFRDFFDLLALSGRDPGDVSPTEILKLITRQKGLNNVPGEEWIYSNSNYFLLAEVVQRATKMSLARFAAKNIFRPLGMTHTLFYDDNALVVPNRVAAYGPGKNGNFQVDWSTTYDLVGGGGLMSNLDDLLLWDRNFYSNKLGKGTLLKELLSHGVLNNDNQINYAMGLSLGDYRGLPTVEHNGALFGYRTGFLRFPQQRFSVIVLCNLSSTNTESLSHQIADLYLQRNFAPASNALHVSSGFPDAANFAGTYFDPGTKTIYKFAADHGNLVGWGAMLRRIDANKFYDLGGNVITFDKANGIMHASLRVPEKVYFSGDRVQPVEPNGAELTKLEGNFYSEELGVTYALFVDRGRLTVKKPDNTTTPLDAVTHNEFYSDNFGTIVFDTDAGQRVSGFIVFRQAARRIIFTTVN